MLLSRVKECLVVQAKDVIIDDDRQKPTFAHSDRRIYEFALVSEGKDDFYSI